MPFKRRRFRRRFKKRFKRSRGGKIKRTFKKVFRKLKEVKPERKLHEVVRGLDPFGTGTSGVILTGLAEGAAQGQRIGRKVMFRKLEMRLNIQANMQIDSTTDTQDARATQSFRLVILQFAESFGSGQSDIKWVNFFSGNQKVDAFYSMAPIHKPYKVLWDKIYQVSKFRIHGVAGGAGGAGYAGLTGTKGGSCAFPTEIFRKIKIRLPRKVIRYDNTTNAATHNHNIWVLGETSDSATAPTAIAPIVGYDVRMWYTDV